MHTDFSRQREKMVREQIAARGIEGSLILKAMGEVRREAFVPEEHQLLAYSDGPLPIGDGQTISQPYIVAYMIDQLDLEVGDKVLDIGGGSGYQAAVLAAMGMDVVSVELRNDLAEKAKETLHGLGYGNIKLVTGNGFAGYSAEAPYDGIISGCAPLEIPQSLVDQLKPNAHLIIPVGPAGNQCIEKVTRLADGNLQNESLIRVSFVPMTDT